jgi:hypothetical protein
MKPIVNLNINAEQPVILVDYHLIYLTSEQILRLMKQYHFTRIYHQRQIWFLIEAS